ncbi:hypothetical protein ABT126_24090 [Streptomyces sp. NPDC002012]|uniref:hypothetical protein n=1 Tax=Streptomyces sp. NPDC002012 TaxID=3154532 RepID=UPI0033199E00
MRGDRRASNLRSTPETRQGPRRHISKPSLSFTKAVPVAASEGIMPRNGVIDVPGASDTLLDDVLK